MIASNQSTDARKAEICCISIDNVSVPNFAEIKNYVFLEILFFTNRVASTQHHLETEVKALMRWFNIQSVRLFI
jgi:hypothetical protein